MIYEPKRSLGFICPECGAAVIVEKSPFELTASNSEITCPCGKSSVKIKLHNDKLKLSVPCIYCEETHEFSCSMHAFLHEKAMAFACGVSSLDACYIGEKEPVFAAMKRLEETLDNLELEAAKDSMFLNQVVMEEILAELRDIAQRGGIGCSCGKSDFGVEVNYSSVELVCAHCGGALKIPASTLSDVDDLCCKMRLTIKGKNKE